MRAMLVFSLAACSAPPAPAPAPARPPPQRDLAVAEPTPKQPAPPQPDGVPYRRGEWILRGTEQERRFDPPIQRRVNVPPQELDVAERDLWSPCVRDFVQAQPDHVRRALRAVFARYAVTCDADKRVVIEPPHDLRGKTRVVFRGTFARDRRELVIELAACSARSSFTAIEISVDGKPRWAEGVTTDQLGDCTIAAVPEMRSLRRALRDAIDAKTAAVEFVGSDLELPISDDTRRDLRLVLDALDALSVR